jgi:uncharacterized membrane protein
MAQLIPTNVSPSKRAAVAPAARRAVTGLFLVCLGLSAMRDAGATQWPAGAGWLDAALVLTATAATLLSLARELPVQNVLLSATLIAGVGAFGQVMSGLSGFPSGPIVYSPAAGPRLLDILPWWIPLVWVVALLNARGTARLVLRRRQPDRYYGFEVLGLTLILTLVLDLGLAPFAVRVREYWAWPAAGPDGGWYGTPFAWIAGRILTALVTLLIVTPFLINKSPAPRPPAFHPLLIWVLVSSVFLAAAIAHGFRAAALPGLLVTLAVVALAWPPRSWVKGASRPRPDG